MIKNNAKPSYLKVAIKVAIFLTGAFLWLTTAYAIIEIEAEEAGDYYGSDAYKVNQCNEYYYEKQYDELFDFMHLYEAYDERYDVYWEVMNAYIDLQEYYKWKSVSETDIEDAREMEQMYKEKVIERSNNPSFPQNQKYLDDFVEMLKEAD